MSNEPETKMPEKVYVLAALLGIMTKDPEEGIGVDAFVAKYSVTPEERRQIAHAALHEKVGGSGRLSVDAFVRREGLTEDDIREAAFAVIRGGLESEEDCTERIASAVAFLVGKGKLIDPEGPSWGYTGEIDYEQDLAEKAGCDVTPITDLVLCDPCGGVEELDLPELWQLVRDACGHIHEPRRTTIGEAIKVFNSVDARIQLFGAAPEWFERFQHAREEFGDALKDEIGCGTTEEFDVVPTTTPLGPKSEALFAVVKQLIEEATKNR